MKTLSLYWLLMGLITASAWGQAPCYYLDGRPVSAEEFQNEMREIERVLLGDAFRNQQDCEKLIDTSDVDDDLSVEMKKLCLEDLEAFKHRVSTDLDLGLIFKGSSGDTNALSIGGEFNFKIAFRKKNTEIEDNFLSFNNRVDYTALGKRNADDRRTQVKGKHHLEFRGHLGYDRGWDTFIVLGGSYDYLDSQDSSSHISELEAIGGAGYTVGGEKVKARISVGLGVKYRWLDTNGDKSHALVPHIDNRIDYTFSKIWRDSLSLELKTRVLTEFQTKKRPRSLIELKPGVSLATLGGAVNVEARYIFSYDTQPFPGRQAINHGAEIALTGKFGPKSQKEKEKRRLAKRKARELRRQKQAD